LVATGINESQTSPVLADSGKNWRRDQTPFARPLKIIVAADHPHRIFRLDN
jgi:hypothetical protein